MLCVYSALEIHFNQEKNAEGREVTQRYCTVQNSTVLLKLKNSQKLTDDGGRATLVVIR
jgi:hypothetical protein